MGLEQSRWRVKRESWTLLPSFLEGSTLQHTKPKSGRRIKDNEHVFGGGTFLG